MEFLVVLVVLVFAIAIIVLDRQRFARELGGERRRGDQLLDRLMSHNLAEYQTFTAPADEEERPQLLPESPAGRWVHDPTGLSSVFVAASEEA